MDSRTPYDGEWIYIASRPDLSGQFTRDIQLNETFYTTLTDEIAP